MAWERRKPLVVYKQREDEVQVVFVWREVLCRQPCTYVWKPLRGSSPYGFETVCQWAGSSLLARLVLQQALGVHLSPVLLLEECTATPSLLWVLEV